MVNKIESLDLESRPFSGQEGGMVEVWSLVPDLTRKDRWGRPKKLMQILTRDPETGKLVPEFIDPIDLPDLLRSQLFFSQS